MTQIVPDGFFLNSIVLSSRTPLAKKDPSTLKHLLKMYTTVRIGCFQKWWYPTTMGVPTKNDHFGVFWGYPYFRKHPIHWNTRFLSTWRYVFVGSC